jgi:hypothetical protein
VRRQLIFIIFFGTIVSFALIFIGFPVFTFYLGTEYIRIMGDLIHHVKSINQGLLYVFSQACALGGAGGILFVLQTLIMLIHSNESWFLPESTRAEYFLTGIIIPIKGVIAGAMAGGIIGGISFAVGGLERIARLHLLILGVSCLAGYSEQVLQKIVQFGSQHADRV